LLHDNESDMSISESEFAQLKLDIQGLKDIEAIKHLKPANFRGIDTADLQLLASVLHRDVTAHSD
jgi:hypothetical protein